jgi:acetyl esterase/lipase
LPIVIIWIRDQLTTGVEFQMSVTPAPTTEWTGPTRFLAPPEPRVQADGTKRYEGITYAAVPGYRPLQLDVWVPATPVPPPLVVWIHGGGWMFGDRRYLPETLRPNQLFEESVAAGLAIATIEYRHALETHFPAQLHDAKAAIRYLRAHAEVLGIDATKIGVWGESAGGHLAALVGLTGQHAELEGAIGVLRQSSAVDVVVDWYGPADLALQPREGRSPEIAAKLPPEMLTPPEELLAGGNDEHTLAIASPVSYVTPAAPSFLLIHGTADTVVPYVQSEVLTQALASAGVSVQLVGIDGADHIFNGYDDIDGVVRLSVDYLAKALRTPPG